MSIKSRKNFELLSIKDRLLEKIKAYHETIWRDNFKPGKLESWISNFHNDDEDIQYKEQVNMIYLLSRFMYFGNQELRQLLFSLYRDLIKYPIVSAIRKFNKDTIDIGFIENEFQKELDLTRILGVGNPSESGVHLLYYFRQECELSKECFMNSGDIFLTKQITKHLSSGGKRSFLRSEIRNKNIKRYIFIDDFCGSGTQASRYLKNLAENIKFEDPKLEVKYLVLFGTESGIAEVKKIKAFDVVDSVFTFDESFKAFETNSRYYIQMIDKIINKSDAKKIVKSYQHDVGYSSPFGYKDGQLLFGLFHNTPDNTLPIFWSEKNNWKSIFKRYHKIY